MASPARRVPTFSATRPISTSISIATAPAFTAFPPPTSQSLLRAAYSQNYVYLIKQADDQYQVILEADDQARTGPEDLRQIYVKPDNGSKLDPGPRAHDIETRHSACNRSITSNQFTSVTFGFDTKPGVALGDVTDFHQENSGRSVAADGERRAAGRRPCPATTLSGAALPRHRGALRHVRDSRHSLRELRPSDHGALHALPGGRRRLDDALDFQFHALALLRDRPLPPHGHREEERHHDCRLRACIGWTKVTTGARRFTKRASNVFGRSS